MTLAKKNLPSAKYLSVVESLDVVERLVARSDKAVGCDSLVMAVLLSSTLSSCPNIFNHARTHVGLRKVGLDSTPENVFWGQ